MKQYHKNKIWVPVEEEDSVPANSRTIDGESYRPYSYVIVLTIEELSALWNAGYRAAYSDLGKETRIQAVDFETYLQSKGINTTTNGK